MLNHVKLIAQMQQVSDALFRDVSHEYSVARGAWDQIVNDPLFIYKVQSMKHQVPWQLPLWQGKLDLQIPVDQNPMPYQGISVDGSQIYPDRHQGTNCFLINIGSVILQYGMASGSYFDSVPYVFAGDTEADGLPISPDYVNCLRQAFEFQGGLDLIQQKMLPEDKERTFFLFDGSLIFWHLSGKQPELKQFFLTRYMDLLEQWYQTKVLFAGYISLPKSKELVNLVRAFLCNFDPDRSDAHMAVEHVVDAHIAQFFLTPGYRSIVFKSTSDICREYPEHLQPYFFYLHVGNEVARIEIPSWIAQSDDLVDTLARAIVDQCVKGRGYPVLIAEAHEQAVVKGPDRDFFYHMIMKLGIDQKRNTIFSQKVIKKRGIGI
ncbi:MAG TPA: DNA double-strand break repair nuclease NurA [Candidatus Babeliales bacterium]|nr:DNA double-strand break repair nuclease NurA [Candidatus Babeliales bacterium]